VRQSRAHQVLHNRESSALHTPCPGTADSARWSEIESLMTILARSAAGGVQRAGFERMVAEVCLGKVGAGLRTARSRASPRNSRELATADRDVPPWSTQCWVDSGDDLWRRRHGNDRLLLAEGQASMKIRARSPTPRRSLSGPDYEKARRGELVVRRRPVGFVKAGDPL